ncbi:MAG: hypothetical protein ACJAT1_000823 [Marivirga sp.]|jgi:hypothetical protein
MRSLLSIGFSFLFLMQSFAPNGDLCCELQKIPQLVNHYLEHKAFDGDSFYQFLAEDFFNEGHDLAGAHDKQEHEDMPFHGNHQCTHGPVFISSTASIELSQLIEVNTINYPAGKIQDPTEFIESPFQPPRA